jgi:hypothetical protein
MLIHPTLLIQDPALVEGLATGTIKRFGGVLREASTGRIVKHLLEVPGQSLLLNPLDTLVNVVGHAATHRKLEVIQQTLATVLQASQIAAAASVLNLGISVAGFAYMGYKLNQLQTSITTMQSRMDAGFDRVEAKLDAIAGQLGYLLLLVEANAVEQQRLRTSLAEVQRTLLVAELADLQSRLDELARFPGDSPKEALRTAGKVRRTLSDQAVQTAPEVEPRVLLVADIAIRGWVVATVTEADLLLRLGKHRDAYQLIESEHPRFVQIAERWADKLLDEERPQLRTAYRFEDPRFHESVLPERIERIVRVHQADRRLTEERRRWVAQEAAIEFKMSYNTPLGEDWNRRQVAIAEYVDGLSELSSRMEARGAFARECERRQLPSSLEVLPDSQRPPGLYVLADTGVSSHTSP